MFEVKRFRVDRRRARPACYVPLAGLLTALFVMVAGCARDGALSTAEVEAIRTVSLPSDPDDPAWKAAPVFTAPLILQDLVEPRLMQPSTREVQVRAMTDGRQIAFRLEWQDATTNDLPVASRFPDACAVQLPSGSGPDVPAPQMGEPGRGVEILYWRASWQATIDGRPDSIRAFYPNATVDHYPFEAPGLGPDEQRAMADRYAPARRLENRMGGPRDKCVEDLSAEGPGSITPAWAQHSQGLGRRTAAGWHVVLTRDVPSNLGSDGRTQAAFAVWDGERGEVGARKMRSVWFPLLVHGSGALAKESR